MRPLDRWAALALASLACAASITARAGDVKSGPAAPPEAKLAKAGGRPWLTDLAAGRTEAIARKRPIFVRLGAEWCPWCRKLESELAKNEIQKVLERWTLVALDVDKNPRDTAALGAISIPAPRLLTPAGKVAASRDGFVTANDLVAWLEENQAKIGESPPVELAESGPPGAIAVVRLARQLDQSDALVREAAINRLSGHPSEAAATVVEGFASGSLQTRLAALELLQTWKVPAAGLDPGAPQPSRKPGSRRRANGPRNQLRPSRHPRAVGPRHRFIPPRPNSSPTPAGRSIGSWPPIRPTRPRFAAPGSTRPGVAAGRPPAIESSRDRLLTRATDRAAVSTRRFRRTRAQMARRSGKAVGHRYPHPPPRRR